MTAAPKSVAVQLREAAEEDHAFILDSWCKSYEPIMPAYERTHGLSRFAWTQWQAKKLLAMHGAAVVELESEPGAILGWVCGRYAPDEGWKVLHYVYVRAEARRVGLWGLAARLLGHADLVERAHDVSAGREHAPRPARARLVLEAAHPRRTRGAEGDRVKPIKPTEEPLILERINLPHVVTAQSHDASWVNETSYRDREWRIELYPKARIIRLWSKRLALTRGAPVTSIALESGISWNALGDVEREEVPVASTTRS